MSTPTLTDIGWTAGIIDGEGSIAIHPRIRSDAIKKGIKFKHNGWRMCITVTNTDPRIVRTLQSLWGGSCNLDRDTTEKWAAAWRWTLPAKSALPMLHQVTPFLVSKKEQAVIALSFQMRMGNPGRAGVTHEEDLARMELYHRIKKLNKKHPLRYEHHR